MNQCTYVTTQMDSSERTGSSKTHIHDRVRKLHARTKPYGVHSSTKMQTAGFKYTGENDIARCDECDLVISGWTKAMKPFTVHADRSPACPFVRSRLPSHHLELCDQENPAKRQKTDFHADQCKSNYRFSETNKMKEIRPRTFSHWSHRMRPLVEQCIAAGFFSCNVGDRVICLYCNLICQEWLADIDDPSEVHRTLSPRCPYVLSTLTYPELSSTLILNDISTNHTNHQTLGSHHINSPRFDQIVYTNPCHTLYSDITKREESFRTWSGESAPPVDQLVRAGFFYTGASNIVTCFYCNGSLQNWSVTDNPINEHARWFSHCPYAKQLCGDEHHRRIQEANRLRQGKYLAS